MKRRENCRKKDILLILVSLILCSVFKATGKIIGDFEYSQTFMLLYLCLENILEKEYDNKKKTNRGGGSFRFNQKGD